MIDEHGNELFMVRFTDGPAAATHTVNTPERPSFAWPLPEQMIVIQVAGLTVGFFGTDGVDQGAIDGLQEWVDCDTENNATHRYRKVSESGMPPMMDNRVARGAAYELEADDGV